MQLMFTGKRKSFKVEFTNLLSLRLQKAGFNYITSLNKIISIFRP